MRKLKSKKYVKYLAMALFGVALFLIFENKFMAFNAYTHKFVTKNGLEIIEKFNNDLSDAGKKVLFDDKDKKFWETVEAYSLKPDEDEIYGGYKYHFYNFITEKNFMNEKDSALNRLDMHFNNAVNEYKNKNSKLAYQELGRAIHFLEDLNTPVHVVYQLSYEAVSKFPLHVRFEKKCDEVCKQISIKEKFEDVSLNKLEYYEANSLETIGQASSILSENNFFGLENNFAKVSEKSANNAIYNALDRVVGLLYKFFKQISL